MVIPDTAILTFETAAEISDLTKFTAVSTVEFPDVVASITVSMTEVLVKSIAAVTLSASEAATICPVKLSRAFATASPLSMPAAAAASATVLTMATSWTATAAYGAAAASPVLTNGLNDNRLIFPVVPRVVLSRPNASSASCCACAAVNPLSIRSLTIVVAGEIMLEPFGAVNVNPAPTTAPLAVSNVASVVTTVRLPVEEVVIVYEPLLPVVTEGSFTSKIPLPFKS